MYHNDFFTYPHPVAGMQGYAPHLLAEETYCALAGFKAHAPHPPVRAAIDADLRPLDDTVDLLLTDLSYEGDLYGRCFFDPIHDAGAVLMVDDTPCAIAQGIAPAAVADDTVFVYVAEAPHPPTPTIYCPTFSGVTPVLTHHLVMQGAFRAYP